MPKERILVTVKTYPSISTKYDELVCTAGFREGGSWVRIYPIPYRKLDFDKQYKKYEWLEVDIVKNTSDFRPETYSPRLIEDTGTVIGKIDTSSNWKERKKIVLNNVFTSLDNLIAQAKDKSICTSLAVFKPKEVIDFTYKPVERE